MTDQPNNPPRPAPVESSGSTSGDAAPSPAELGLPAQGGDILNIIANVEKQLEKVRDFQQSHEAQVRSLAERQASLDKMRQELEQTAAEMSRREQAVQELRQSIEQREAALNDQAAELEAQAKEHARQAAEMQLARQAFDSQQSKVREAEQRLSTAKEELRGQHDSLSQREQSLQQREAEIEQRSGDLRKQQSQLDADRAEMEQTHAAVMSKAEALGQEVQQHAKAAETAKNLAEQAGQKLAEQTARLEKIQANAQQAEKARDEALTQCNALQAQLDQAGERAIQMDAELRRFQQQHADSQKKLELAGAKLSELSQVVARQAADLEQLPAAMAEIQDQRRQIEQLQAQAAQVADSDEQTAVLEAQAEAHAKAMDEARQSARIFEQRVHDLEQELTTAREQAAKAGAGSESAQQALREKTAMLKTAAKHLQLRKQRLQRWKAAMARRLETRRAELAQEAQSEARAASNAAVESARKEYEQRTRQLADLDRQRHELAHVQAMLADTERRMIRRWARPRAAIVVAAMTIQALVLAGASWFATDRFFPAKVVATVTVQAASRAGQSLGADDLTKWQQWHTAIVNDDSFHSTLAKRFDARQMDDYRKPEAVASRLKADLKVDDHVSGEVTYSLAGTNAQETLVLMDTIASTVLSESARQTGKRGDGAKAAIPGERKDAAIRFASLAPRPLVDQRLTYAGILFGVAFVLTTLLAIVIYSRLLRSKRSFEQQNSALGPDAPEPTVPIR